MIEHEDGKCTFGEDGQCALHGIEVERRKNMQVLTDNIPKMLTWQNRIVGWSILVTLSIGGAYVYTKEVRDDMKAQYAASVITASSDMKRVSDQVSALATGQARIEERYDALLRSITDMNNNIATLTYLQLKERDMDQELKKSGKR